jgi:predicted amidohydrolase
LAKDAAKVPSTWQKEREAKHAVLARAGDGDGIALAELDGGYLAQVRRELPALAHRRL